MRDFLKRGEPVPPPVVLGTGLIALDMILGVDTTKPPALMTGGTCGNVLAILGFLGWEPFPVARLNGDAASEKVKRDLIRWGAALDFATQDPQVETPIIVQTIRRDRNGQPKHRFSLICPDCGAWFPAFRPITSAAAIEVGTAVVDAVMAGFSPKVFFFDRVSRGAVDLARILSDLGALVVFEPTGVGEPSLFDEALGVAHLLKYSRDRLPRVANRRRRKERLLLEIETRGSDGLRYRSDLLRSIGWQHLNALSVPSLADTAGAGDWCTAGILDRIGRNGLAGLQRLSARKLEEAIRFGQATAAVACGYEGARGAMYALSRRVFDDAVSAIKDSTATHTVDSNRIHASSYMETDDLTLCLACS